MVGRQAARAEHGDPSGRVLDLHLVVRIEKIESGVVTTPVTVTSVPTGYGLFWTPLEVTTCKSPMGTANAVAAMARRRAGMIIRGARRIDRLRRGCEKATRMPGGTRVRYGASRAGPEVRGVPREGKRKPGDRQRG